MPGDVSNWLPCEMQGGADGYFVERLAKYLRLQSRSSHGQKPAPICRVTR